LDKIEEKLDHKSVKQEKPLIKLPELRLGNSLKVNKNKSVEKIEEMLKELVKTKQEQPSSSNTVAVATIPKSSDNSSETKSTSKSDSDDNIKQVEKALSSLELRMIHKPKFPPTSLTKNWYPRPNENNVIEYNNLTYGNIISVIKEKGLTMCIGMKISNQANKDKKKAKYEMGNFCEQYGLPSVERNTSFFFQMKRSRSGKRLKKPKEEMFPLRNLSL
jgi:hypothetical protein